MKNKRDGKLDVELMKTIMEDYFKPFLMASLEDSIKRHEAMCQCSKTYRDAVEAHESKEKK